MKFKSDLAQEAYEEIYDRVKYHAAYNGVTGKDLATIEIEATARAIEVAAKIEIEEYKADTERTIAMWKAEIAKERCLQKVCVHGFGPLSPDWIRYQSEKPKECAHKWFSRVDGWYCTECGFVSGVKKPECEHEWVNTGGMRENDEPRQQCHKCGEWGPK